MGMDTATGDTIFRTHSAGSTPTDQIKLELSSGDIYWKSGTSFYGRFSHDISAARVWTWPDITGTMLVTDAQPALGGGLAALLGTIGGSGPTAEIQSKWVSINIGGTTYFIPVWV